MIKVEDKTINKGRNGNGRHGTGNWHQHIIIYTNQKTLKEMIPCNNQWWQWYLTGTLPHHICPYYTSTTLHWEKETKDKTLTTTLYINWGHIWFDASALKHIQRPTGFYVQPQRSLIQAENLINASYYQVQVHHINRHPLPGTTTLQ